MTLIDINMSDIKLSFSYLKSNMTITSNIDIFLHSY